MLSIHRILIYEYEQMFSPVSGIETSKLQTFQTLSSHPPSRPRHDTQIISGKLKTSETRLLLIRVDHSRLHRSTVLSFTSSTPTPDPKSSRTQPRHPHIPLSSTNRRIPKSETSSLIQLPSKRQIFLPSTPISKENKAWHIAL